MRWTSPQGVAWVDLNDHGTRKYSDADYLTVMGFKCISDDRDPLNQLAQSHQLDRLLRAPTPDSLEHREREAVANARDFRFQEEKMKF